MFTDDVIDAYINLKTQEVTRLRMSTHPVRARALLQRLGWLEHRVPAGRPIAAARRVPPSMTHFADRGYCFVSGIAYSYASGP